MNIIILTILLLIILIISILYKSNNINYENYNYTTKIAKLPIWCNHRLLKDMVKKNGLEWCQKKCKDDSGYKYQANIFNTTKCVHLANVIMQMVFGVLIIVHHNLRIEYN